MKKIGIIICARYKDCGGGKCFRALRERQGAFSIYPANEPVEIVGYSTCGGCPGETSSMSRPSSRRTMPKSFTWPQAWWSATHRARASCNSRPSSKPPTACRSSSALIPFPRNIWMSMENCLSGKTVKWWNSPGRFSLKLRRSWRPIIE
jgi:hypothetical protein